MAAESSSEFKSALQANIEAKGSNAYYHAWKKDARNNDPNAVPERVGSEAAQIAKPSTPIANYSYADSLSKVSVYVPLANIESHDASLIEFSCTAASFDLIVREWEGGRDHRLHVPHLHADVDPDRCKHAVKTGKIVLTLRKQTDADWPDLRKK